MEKEILFKGKRIDNGEWIEGQLAYFFDNKETPYIMPKCYYATREMGEDEDDNPIISDEIAFGGFISVQSKTVCQFTGLIDEKSNKIFAQDIVKIKSKHGFNSDLLEEFRVKNNLETLNGICYHFQGVVRIDLLRGLMFENMENTYQEPMFTRHIDIKKNHSELEVIGNIHD